MSLPAGTQLGPYEVLRSIGAGGMGEVYEARDTRLDRLVAVKVLPGSLAGETLQQRLQRGPLDIAQVVDFGIALADALDAAHARGLIHRDLKPANIFITTRGVPRSWTSVWRRAWRSP
jgi:serine/threonine protein kinase